MDTGDTGAGTDASTDRGHGMLRTGSPAGGRGVPGAGVSGAGFAPELDCAAVEICVAYIKNMGVVGIAPALTSISCSSTSVSSTDFSEHDELGENYAAYCRGKSLRGILSAEDR